jgi:hypothetical protein
LIDSRIIGAGHAIQRDLVQGAGAEGQGIGLRGAGENQRAQQLPFLQRLHAQRQAQPRRLSKRSSHTTPAQRPGQGTQAAFAQGKESIREAAPEFAERMTARNGRLAHEQLSLNIGVFLYNK